jgi:hypothetical protein
MLTFKKGSYTYAELRTIENALLAAQNSFKCPSTGCGLCVQFRPCGDIARCLEYVTRLCKEKQNEQNQPQQ